jgi:hypothetical protein
VVGGKNRGSTDEPVVETLGGKGKEPNHVPGFKLHVVWNHVSDMGN